MNSKTVPEMLATAFLRLRGIVGGIIFINGVKGATMTKKVAVSLSLVLLAGSLMMLVPSEVRAQGPLCPRPYAFAWDWGYAPFDSPYGYLNSPVNPLSAEWGPMDSACSCWASTAWALGLNAWDSDSWLSNFLRYSRHSNYGSNSPRGLKQGSESRRLVVAVLRPMPTDRHPSDPALRGSSADKPDRATRSNRGTSHRATTSGQSSTLTGYEYSTTSSGGGYSGQNSSSAYSSGTTSSGGASYSGKNR
jgi:hypothetical protein